MRIRPVLAAAAAAGVLVSPLAFAAPGGPAPQITDPAGDANFLNGEGLETAGPLAGNNSTPVGSQDYADVTAVTWTPTTTQVVTKTKNKKTKKVKTTVTTVVTGFTVRADLKGAPTPPAPSIVVYRMLGVVGGDSTKYLGVTFYSAPNGDGSAPQSAVRDNLGDGGNTRLTKIDLPKIDGTSLTWTVPLSALPKEFKPGSTLTNLYFEVKEIEDFHGQKVPSTLPTGHAIPVAGGSMGLGTGLIDGGSSTSSFKVG